MGLPELLPLVIDMEDMLEMEWRRTLGADENDEKVSSVSELLLIKDGTSPGGGGEGDRRLGWAPRE
jgi:hypothetical protein